MARAQVWILASPVTPGPEHIHPAGVQGPEHDLSVGRTLIPPRRGAAAGGAVLLDNKSTTHRVLGTGRAGVYIGTQIINCSRGVQGPDPNLMNLYCFVKGIFHMHWYPADSARPEELGSSIKCHAGRKGFHKAGAGF